MLANLIKDYSLWAIEHGGLFGAGVMMALESMIAPVPSEMVMPPLGYAVQQGKFTWFGAIAATSTGSLAGSLVSYYLGYFGGKPLVMKVGRFLLLNEEHLDLTHRWFEKHGSSTVFICRFVPVVRHFISIPAGMARMSLLKFALYTVVGATIWNTFLLWVGFKLADHWAVIEEYRKPVDIAIVALLAIAFVAWVWLHLRKRKPQSAPEPSETRK